MMDKKKYVWHKMDESMLPSQPFYLWTGKETNIAIRSQGQNSYVIYETNSAIEHWKLKDQLFKDYRWAYVNQDLELRPTPE